MRSWIILRIKKVSTSKKAAKYPIVSVHVCITRLPCFPIFRHNDMLDARDAAGFHDPTRPAGCSTVKRGNESSRRSGGRIRLMQALTMRQGQKPRAKRFPIRTSQRELNAPLERSVPVPLGCVRYPSLPTWALHKVGRLAGELRRYRHVIGTAVRHAKETSADHQR
jgi:hypothetical protein